MSGGGFYPRTPPLLVTVADDLNANIWLLTGTEMTSEGKVATVERLFPDALARVGHTEWWPTTDTDTVRVVPWWLLSPMDGVRRVWPPKAVA